MFLDGDGDGELGVVAERMKWVVVGVDVGVGMCWVGRGWGDLKRQVVNEKSAEQSRFVPFFLVVVGLIFELRLLSCPCRNSGHCAE